MKRNIIRIDEDLCNGCGACVPGCAEGALQIVDGKAKLVKEQYCDGLGACLGECPTGALTIEQRESEGFDEVATNEWLKSIGRDPISPGGGNDPFGEKHEMKPLTHAQGGGCPGSRVMSFNKPKSVHSPSPNTQSELGQWPVQLTLVPVNAPYFMEADLLIAADCVPFAYPDFHRKMLKGRAVVIACPKLDNAEHYVDKLAEMIRVNDFCSITIAHMEVPCCFGLGRLVDAAMKKSGVKVPVLDINVGIDGELQ